MPRCKVRLKTVLEGSEKVDLGEGALVLKAWLKFMLRTLRDGSDNMTGRVEQRVVGRRRRCSRRKRR